MIGTLARELQKYFTRKGNRVVFANGMSLNQLALVMWERLGFAGVDPSVVSRVISGKRLFSFKQLEIFSRVLTLSKRDMQQLKQSLANDIFKRFGLDDSSFGQEDGFIDSISEEILRISQIRSKDLPVLANEWINLLFPKLEERLLKTSDRDSRKKLLRLKYKLLLEKAPCLIETTVPNKIHAKIAPISESLISLGKELGDSKICTMGNFYLGCSFYNTKEYSRCVNFFLEETENPTSDFHELLSLRCLAISFASLREITAYKRIKDRMLTSMLSSELHNQCSVVEGLARAEGLMGNLDSFQENINLAWRLSQKEMDPQSDYFVLKRLQVIRTDLEINSRISSGANKDYLEKIGKEGLSLAKIHGFRKYASHINGFLDKILN